jgi:hypothetical protein
MAAIPFQSTFPLDARLNARVWTGITGADGNLTQTVQWPADMKSIAVEVGTGHFTRGRVNPLAPTAAEAEAELNARLAFRGVLNAWAFKSVYRVGVPTVGQDVTIDVIAQPAISLKGTVDLPRGLYQDLFATVAGQGTLRFRQVQAGGKVSFEIAGAPKGEVFHSVVGVGDVIRCLPQPASTATVDLGTINHSAWVTGAREVNLQVEYPADSREGEKRPFFFFVQSDGTTVYGLNRADSVHWRDRPPTLPANQLVGGAQFVNAPTTAMLPPGEYVVLTAAAIQSEAMQSLLTRLRAGEPPASTGLYRVTIPAEGDATFVLPGRDVYNKEMLSRPKTSPLEVP